MSFDGLGLDARLLRALNKLGLAKPTPVQAAAIPPALAGDDIVARARTGSGKTLAYLLPALQRVLEAGATDAAWQAVVLVPTRELCRQVAAEALRVAEAAGQDLAVTSLAGEGSARVAPGRVGAVVVTTPARLAEVLAEAKPDAAALTASWRSLVMDEADLLLAYGYADDMKVIAGHVPRSCQCSLFSATLSSDVEELTSRVLHSPQVLDLLTGHGDAGVATEVSHWRVDVPGEAKAKAALTERLVRVLALLRLGLVPRKVLAFANSVESGLRLRLFLEAFGVRAALVHAELPANSRAHALQEFNRGLFDVLIAADDVHSGAAAPRKPVKKSRKPIKRRAESEPAKDEEFGVTRGVDFKGVATVINFEMPASVQGYVHRLGRTGRAGAQGMGISLVSPDDEPLAAAVAAALAPSPAGGEVAEDEALKPFTKLTKEAVAALRYRGEDVARSITQATLTEARAKELKAELLNSKRLETFFEEHPADLQLLKHDRPLTATSATSAPHLKHLPAYLRGAANPGKSYVGSSGGGVLPLKKRRRTESVDPIKGFVRAPRKGADKNEPATEMELKAKEYGKKHRVKQPGQFTAKRNVRKNKTRKR